MSDDPGPLPWQTVAPEILHSAYTRGWFPMAADDAGAIHLFEANPRGILPLTESEGLHIPASVERVIRARRFAITSDRDFGGVLDGCALPRIDDGVWLSAQLKAAMMAMHEAGFAHSVEAWRTDPATGAPHLVGGIYGVSVGRVFCAESMFHIPRQRLADGARHPLDGTDASKVCLVALVRHLVSCGYGVLDIQMVTPHTARFGAIAIHAREYHARIDPLVEAPDAWRPVQS